MERDIIYTRERHVTSGYLDNTGKLGISQAALMVQDSLTELFGMLDADNYAYKQKYNVFWAFLKTKIHFTRRPSWNESFTGSSFPAANGGLRTDINTIFTDKEGNAILTANVECCCLDFEKHRPVRLTTLDFPKENFPAAVFTDSFEKFAVEFSEEDFVLEQKIYSQMMDMSHHMNNTEYVKLAVNAFSDEFITSHEPKDLEVHFTGESTEGQLLRVYKKQVDDAFYLKIKEQDRSVFEMKISFN